MPVIFALVPALLLLALLLRLISRVRQLRQQLSQHEQLFEQLGEGVLLVDSDGKIRQHNQAALRLLGCTDAPQIGTRLTDCLPQLDVTASAPQRLQLLGADGSKCILDVSRFAATSPGEHLLLLRTASESGRSLDDIERFKRSQYFARIGTWDWDIDTNRLYWSEAIYAMFGHSVGAVRPSYKLFCASVHPDDSARVRSGELHCIESGENHDEEYRVIWPDGSVHWLRETGNVVKNQHGLAVKMMGVVRDITEEKAWASQMHQLAHHDALTGLPNRLLFEDRLDRALERARRSNTRVALAFIDLNGFKAINDNHGHVAGDQVLVATARRLKAALRESDNVARIGGDEFVVIFEGLALNHTLEEQACAIGEKILDALALPLSDDINQRRIDASLGIAAFPDHAASMDRLIHIADLAMYEAKRSGENQYRLGSAGQQRPSIE